MTTWPRRFFDSSKSILSKRISTNQIAPFRSGSLSSALSHTFTEILSDCTGKGKRLFSTRTTFVFGAREIEARVEVSAVGESSGAWSPSTLWTLPRVGLRLLMSPEFGTSVCWQGLGPHECYPDRKASAVPGVFSGLSVDDMQV